MLPPLNVTAEIIDTACRILISVIDQLTTPVPTSVPVPVPA
jgi:hypothetical protein